VTRARNSNDTLARGHVALITGAAAGLGASFAERLAREGADLVLVDRQAARVQALADDLAGRHGIKTYVLVQDLQSPDAVGTIHDRCQALGVRVDTLVNNAGFHLDKPFRDFAWPVLRDNLRLLLDVVVEMTHRFLPAMIERRWGRVINVASMSGFMPGGVRLSTYTPAKAFLIPFSEALNLELEGTGVHVTAICPGFMRTDLFKNSGLTDVSDAVPGFLWNEPDQVADEAVRASMRGDPVHVSGLPNRLILAAAKVIPRGLLRERTRILHRTAHSKNGKRTLRDGPRSGASKAALVTGASAGIGASFAETLARDGYDLVLVARRKAKLEEQAVALSHRFGVKVHVVALDLTRSEAVDGLVSECARLGWPIDVLVNNAGYPVSELFHRMSWEEVDQALQIFIRSVAHLTHQFLPGMVERGWGRVINVASLAGFEPGSYRSSLYSSAKAFVIAFSESVNAELESTGVHVTALCPGFTKTEWASKAKLGPGSVPGLLVMESADVARKGFDGARRGVVVCVVGTAPQRLLSAAFRLAPRRAMGRFLSKKRKAMIEGRAPKS
jgi:short-subunit dehydrogenase